MTLAEAFDDIERLKERIELLHIANKELTSANRQLLAQLAQFGDGDTVTLPRSQYEQLVSIGELFR